MGWNENPSTQAHPPIAVEDATHNTSFADIFNDVDPWSFMDLAGDAEFELQTPPDFSQPTGFQPIDMAGLVRPSQNSLDPDAVDAETQQTGQANDGNFQYVEIGIAEQEPLRHYLNNMTKFCKMEQSQQESMYTAIFSTLALSHQQLFQAMLAWSSLHLAQLRSLSLSDAEERFSRAMQLLKSDEEAFEHLEVTLTTIWFLLQYQCLLADGVDIFCDLLDHATELLRQLFDDYSKDDAIARLGPVGTRVMVWMTAYDARAASVGKAGRLLGCLRTCPYLNHLIEHSITAGMGTTLKGMPHRTSVTSRSSAYAGSLQLAVRLRMVLGQVKLLHRRGTTDEDYRGWAAVETSLRALMAEIDDKSNLEAQAARGVAEGSTSLLPEVSSDGYNQMMLLATLYVAIILYQSFRPTMGMLVVEDFLPARDCALRAIRLMNRISAARPDSPQSVWPHLIFIAALACEDPVYQSWCIRTLLNAEVWGENLRKTRALLETMINMQNRTGHQTVDYAAVMETNSGLFIL